MYSSVPVSSLARARALQVLRRSLGPRLRARSGVIGGGKYSLRKFSK